MKCASHVDQEAVGTCNACGKGLCIECVGRFETPLCEPCLLQHNDSISRELYLGLGITLLVFVGAIYFAMTQTKWPMTNVLVFGVLMSWTYWGWKFLNRYAPRLTQGGLGAWSLYAFVKFLAAYFIGIVVGPYQIYKSVREITAIRQLRNRIRRGEA